MPTFRTWLAWICSTDPEIWTCLVGEQNPLANINLRYWPIRGRVIARKTVRHCIICLRSSPSLPPPFMAPLPRERVNIECKFATGVDFCGTIMIRSRWVVSIKCYVAEFVCFVTRAIHLELVSGLTTEAFLVSLVRFISRRGPCSHIYSDNGTNFVGANKVLHSYFSPERVQSTIEDSLKIQWHFIPPSTPHFGGVWEVTVKSAKRHLLKVNGPSHIWRNEYLALPSRSCIELSSNISNVWWSIRSQCIDTSPFFSRRKFNTTRWTW